MEDEKATLQINMRLRPSERRDLERLAAEWGMSATEAVRKMIKKEAK